MKISLLGLGLIVTILPVAVMLLFIRLMGADIENIAAKEFKSVSMENARQVSIDVRHMCDIIRIADDTSMQSAQTALFAALDNLGKVRLMPEENELEATNQFDISEKRKFKIRKMAFGDTVVDASKSPNAPDNKVGQILSRLKSRFGCDFTVMVKASQSGDMIRLISTLSSPDGGSFTSTYFPEISKTGIRESVVASLLAGESFSGIVDVGLLTLSANYIPLTDSLGNVVGAVFYGVRQTSISELEKYLRNYNSLASSNSKIWIIDNSNAENPILRVSIEDATNGVAINSDAMGEGRHYLSAALAKGVNLRSNEIVSEELLFKNSKGADVMRVVTFTYYRPWKWVIGTLSNVDTYAGSIAELKLQSSAITWKIISAGIVFSIIAILASLLVASKMSRPIKVMMRVARAQSRGDIAGAELLLADYAASRRGGVKEFGVLFESLLSMTRNLAKIIGGVGKTAESTARDGVQIAQTASRLEEISDMENGGVESVSKAGKSIAVSYDWLNKAARKSVRGVSKTLALTRYGNEALVLLKQNCDVLSSTSEKLIERLADITDNVDNISEVITYINDVSARTNMLSLNASIEAERAGELGLGFSVIAKRIRKLADQTSVAAAEIERNVRLVQSSVNSSVIEMDTFTVKMRRNSKIILETIDALGRVISDVETLGPKFEDIASTIASLSQSARGIGAAMDAVDSVSSRVSDKFADFKSATLRLDTTSKNLITEVSRFKTDGKRGAE